MLGPRHFLHSVRFIFHSAHGDLPKNAILLCQSLKKKNPSHSFRTKIKLFNLLYVVFQDLPPACHANFISIALYVLATLNPLQLFINAIPTTSLHLTALAPAALSAWKGTVAFPVRTLSVSSKTQKSSPQSSFRALLNETNYSF